MTNTALTTPSDSVVRRQRGVVRRGPAVVLTVELVVSAVVLIQLNRRLWFFGDDWAYLFSRHLGNGWAHQLFSPHNEHWSTLPIVLYRALFEIFGLRHYMPYFLPMLVAHLAICIVLWLLLRRVGIHPWVATGAVGVLAFLGVGAEDLLWAFQVSFLGSVFFGLVSIWLVDHDGRFARRDVWIWVAAVAGLMCSGVGITMVAVVFVFSLFRRGWRAALAILSVPAVAYLIWYGAIGHAGTARDSFESTQFLNLPAYVWTGLTAAWEGAFGVPNSGALILVALTVPLLVHGARDRATQFAVAGLAGSVFLLLQSGALRISHGVDQATASRYAYIAVALGLPALAWLVDQLVQRSRGANPAAGVALALVCLLLIVNGGSRLRSFAISREDTTARQQSLTIGTEALIQRGERTFNTTIDSRLIPDVTTRRLADPDVQRAFGMVTANRDDIVNASALTQVMIGPESRGLPAPQQAQWEGVRGSTAGLTASGAGPTSPTAGAAPICATGTITSPSAYFQLTAGADGAQVRITSPGSSLATRVIGSGAVSEARTWKTSPDEPVYLASLAPERAVRVSLPDAGEVTVCVGA